MSRNLLLTLNKRITGALRRSNWHLPLLALFVLFSQVIHAQLDVSFSVQEPTCFGLPNGKITATATGGTAPYNYIWNTAATGPVLNNITAGAYSVTVTDGAGGMVVKSVTVGQPPLITAAINVSGGCTSSVTLTAVGGGGKPPYGYYWTTGQNSVSITVSNNGTYCVTITDSNNCGAVACTSVSTQPLTLSVTPTAVTCPGGSDGQVTALPVGGAAPYTYQWSNGGSTQTLNNLPPGLYSVTVTDANGCKANASATVADKPPLVIQTTFVQPTCLNDTNGSITAFPSGGNPPYTYLWSNGATTQTISGLNAGTYTVTVTDNKGCKATKTVVLEPKSKLVVTATGSNETCPGDNNGTATATPNNGTPPYTYAWSNGGNTSTITNLAPGVYSVTVTDQFGCKATGSVTINAATPLSIAVTGVNVSTCEAMNGSASVAVTSGVGPYTYLWNTGATTASIFNLSGGTYSVTVTDSRGCKATGSIVVTEPPAISVSVTATQRVCPGATNGTATAVVTGGTMPFRYTWSNGDTTVTINNLGAGTYTVTVVDANQCRATASRTITESPALNISINANPIVCGPDGTTNATAQVTGGVPPFTFIWNTGAMTQTLVGLTAGMYSVTVSDANGCQATANRTITAINLDVTITKQDILCFGELTGSAAVSVSGGTMPYRYLWNTGDTTTAIMNRMAGTYTVTITDANNCQAIRSVTIAQPTDLILTITGSGQLCPGDSTGTLTASATGGTTPYRFRWNTGDTTATISNLSAGTYRVTVTDANNCTKSDSTTINLAPALNIDIEATEVVCGEENSGTATVKVTGGRAPYSYAWSTGASNPTIENLVGGTYSVTVTDANGCKANKEITIRVIADFAISLVPRNVLCHGDSTGSVLVNVTGGGAPYRFQWNTGDTIAEIVNLAIGTYSVTVTDSNNCKVSATVNINQPPRLDANTAATNLTCPGANDGSITATASGGVMPYTFVWSNGATTATITGLAAGNYTVTITDANFCTITRTTTITQPTQLSVIINSTNILCAGDSTGTANAVVTGGTAPYSYAWSNGRSTANLSNLTPGTYNLTVTDSKECTTTGSVTITQPDSLRLTLTVNNIVCTSELIGSISTLVSGGTAPYTYIWSNGATTASVANLPAGSYSVTVTDANGCKAIGTAGVAQIPNLEVRINKTDVRCFGANNGSATAVASGDAPPYKFVWNTGDTTATITNLAPGVYTVTVTGTAGCIGQASVTINTPTQITLQTTKTDVSCTGGENGQASVTATGGTPPYTYAWSNGGNTANINGLGAGTYTVTVTDANQCTATTSVTVGQPPLLEVRIATLSGTCTDSNNGSLSATATGGTAPYTYAWSNGQSGATLNNLGAGTYTVTVTDAKNCTAVASITLSAFAGPSCSIRILTEENRPNANEGSAQVSITGGTGPYTILWSNGQTTATATGLTWGTYSATVTDANGCKTTCSVTLKAPALIGDFVWLDNNRNGIQDPGEPGIPGVKVIVTGTTEDANYSDTTFTNGNGIYLFSVPPPGNYKVTFVLPAGSTLIPTIQNAGTDDTKDSDADPVMLMTQVIFVERGDTNLTLDAGFYDLCVNLTFAGTIGFDQYLCGPGGDPAPIIELTPPTGGFGAIEYLWMQSTIGGPFNDINWQPIPNSNTRNYDPGPIYETTYFIRCTRRENCPYIETNIVTVTVGNEVVAEINGPGIVCKSTPVTFTATNVGVGATYTWDLGPAATQRFFNTQSATTTFASFGTFEIKLSVTKGNCTSTAVKRVIVLSTCAGMDIDARAINNNQEVMVDWALPNDGVDYQFVVEHAADGATFEAIGEINRPSYNQNNVRYYEFKDPAPKKGWNYYRVRVADSFGNVTISNIAKTVIYAESQLMHVYPNPVNNQLTVEIFDDMNDDVQLQLVSPAGVLLQTVNVPKNTPRQDLDFSNLPAGNYFVKVRYGRIDVKVIKVIKH